MSVLPTWGTLLTIRCAICQRDRTIEYRQRVPAAFCRSCRLRLKRHHQKWGAKHRESGSKLYHVWGQMKYRCTKSNHPNYPDYGGRGIYVCALWLADYRNFATWARANGYREGLYLDRKDNDGPYSPDNCQWATSKEQAYNKRTRAGCLSVEQAKEIRLAYAGGASFSEIKLKYQISLRQFKRLLSGETFARFATK